MSLYLTIWIAICMLSVKEFIVHETKQSKEREFLLLLLIILMMLMFRFGQGSDYFAYRYIYETLSSREIDFSSFSNLHSEYGYLLICNIFRCLDLPFEAFIVFTAIVEVYGFYRFSKVFNLDTPFVLLLAYPTIFMTYFWSAIRQGLVIAVFLGILLPWLIQKDYTKYLIGALICIFFHSAAVILLLLPIVAKIQRADLTLCFCLFAWIGGLASTTSVVRNYIIQFGIKGINYYMQNGAEIQTLSICERILFLIVISVFYRILEKSQNMTYSYKIMYKVYLIGMAFYGVFLGYNNIASRLCGMVRFVELYLIIYFIKSVKFNIRLFLISIFVLLESVMLMKNIDSYIEQGNYINSLTVFSYEYVSVFDSDSIYTIRRVNNAYIEQFK